MEEDMFAVPKHKKNPLVLIGAIATGGVLCAGLVAFRNGNQMMSQQMMRTRVLFQAATVAVMVASTGVTEFGQIAADPMKALAQLTSGSSSSKGGE